ncbi:regulator of microtubule dynamics protein 3 [Brachionichthys hirsutus]|uniref:regulator of microtubule dynamics protein 3 n=1 Tax=Brachionichthys hirsutus TaxID=412623 RepID=UPI0036045EC4
MNTPLGKNGVIGVAVGAAAGLAFITFITFIIHRERSRKTPREAPREAPQPGLLLGEDGATRDAGELQLEAQQHALSPEQQLDLRNQLDQVLTCVSSLRSEVAELRGGLQDIARQIVQDVKKGVEDGQHVRHRRHAVHKERTDSASSSSIYFTASQGGASTAGETSEGGYTTAYAESDYTDRDSDKEEDEWELGQESEEEDRSCATVLNFHQDEDEEERGWKEEEERENVDESRLLVAKEAPSGELALLLAQSDVLHTGDASLKEEGFHLLLDNRAEHGDASEYLWRLARAYGDVYESTAEGQQRTAYAQQGREESDLALKMTGLNAECHKWFALLTGLTIRHESLHGKLKSSLMLKEHLDRAIALRDDDPMSFYLLGKWCYEMAGLDWLEKTAVDALNQSPLNPTLHDALENFLKAEELSPGFSKMVRLYIAKCHKELGNISEAMNWTELALKTETNDIIFKYEEASELEAQLLDLTGISV